MKSISEVKSNPRFVIKAEGEDGFMAFLVKPYREGQVTIIASWSGGWEHVSVGMKHRCPTWEEMCIVKNLFWDENECVVQFHPPKKDYVNCHPYVLHLWKRSGAEYELPPKEFV